MTTPQDGAVLPEGEGRTFPFGDSSMRVLAEPHTTAGALAMVETAIPAGAPASPPHRHHAFDEGFVVVEGALELVIGADVAVARAGAFVWVPRGIRHGFRNPGPAACRVLGLWTPASGLDYIGDLGAALAGNPRDGEAVAEVYRRHRTEPAP